MNDWKYKYFNDNWLDPFGTDMNRGLKMMDKCLQEATVWINQNSIKEFHISHDLSTYESPGARGQMATVVVMYKD